LSAGPGQRLRVELIDRYGTIAEIIEPEVLGDLTARKRARLDSLVGDAVRELAAALGVPEDYARWVLAADLMRHRADEAAYERVCERRGVLPL